MEQISSDCLGLQARGGVRIAHYITSKNGSFSWQKKKIVFIIISLEIWDFKGSLGWHYDQRKKNPTTFQAGFICLFCTFDINDIWSWLDFLPFLAIFNQNWSSGSIIIISGYLYPQESLMGTQEGQVWQRGQHSRRCVRLSPSRYIISWWLIHLHYHP